MTTTRPLRAASIGLAAILTVALAGCGGQALNAPQDTTPASANAADLAAVEFTPISDEELAKAAIEAVQPDPELHNMLPAEFRDELRWVTSSGYPPMEIWNSDNTVQLGVDPALAHAISRALGVRMTHEDADFNAMIPGLQSDRYDVLASSMTDNEERRETTTFVDYVKSGNAFLVAAGNPLGIAEPMDLCGQTVALVDAGSSFLLAQDLSKACEDAGEQPYNILAFPGDNEATLALQSGRAQATVTDYPVAVSRASDPNNELEAVVIEGDESVWGIGVDNSNPELAKAIQAAVQQLMDDGTYQQILDAWGVPAMAIDTATINGE